jgi:hypothetical protein
MEIACPRIDGLVFNEESIKAIEKIKAMRDNRKYLEKFLVGGTFVSIFTGSGPLQASYGVASTDWYYLAQALRAAPTFVRDRIRLQAEIMVVRLQGARQPDNKQLQFWMAVANGCEI